MHYCSTIQRENVNRGQAATIIATIMFKMAFHPMNTSPVMSTPFVSTPDETAPVQKSFKMVFFYPFVANSYTNLLAPNLQIHQTHFRD